MNTKCYLFFLFIALSSFLFSPVIAQEADQRIGDLINQCDWFRLQEEYPGLSDKAQNVPLKKLAEVMIGAYFNRSQKAIDTIDDLLANHQDFLGFDNSCNLIALRDKLVGEQGRYAESADHLFAFLNQVDAIVSRKQFPGHQQLADYYNEIRNLPAPSVTRPGVDTEVPLTVEKAGRGVLMFVPVKVNGKDYRFIFDTGAASTFLSSRMAEEMGVHIVRDSVLIQGVMATEKGKSGWIDSMTIGNSTFRNALVTIANPNAAVDTIYQVDAVLGMDFIGRMGEVVIYPKAGKLVFPVLKSSLPETGRNLWLYDSALCLRATSGDEPLRFGFDTGDARASLFKVYYNRHKNEIDKSAVKDTITSGGFGGVSRQEVLRLKSLPLQVGTNCFEIPDIQVEPENTQLQISRGDDGSLGMDFIKLFDKVVISLDEMFVEVR